jgi:hypothetical protein
MRFEPDHQGWMAYVKFELRYEEVGRARAVFERYVDVLPSVSGFGGGRGVEGGGLWGCGADTWKSCLRWAVEGVVLGGGRGV